jgi:hypothetical protein
LGYKEGTRCRCVGRSRLDAAGRRARHQSYRDALLDVLSNEKIPPLGVSPRPIWRGRVGPPNIAGIKFRLPDALSVDWPRHSIGGAFYCFGQRDSAGRLIEAAQNYGRIEGRPVLLLNASQERASSSPRRYFRGGAFYLFVVGQYFSSSAVASTKAGKANSRTRMISQAMNESSIIASSFCVSARSQRLRSASAIKSVGIESSFPSIQELGLYQAPLEESKFLVGTFRS